MPRQAIEQIQALVRGWDYEVTDHAYEEMADDDLLLTDVETAILTGTIVREDKGDPRGSVYVIQGIGIDRQSAVGAAVRFNEQENVVIITTYRVQ